MIFDWKPSAYHDIMKSKINGLNDNRMNIQITCIYIDIIENWLSFSYYIIRINKEQMD